MADSRLDAWCAFKRLHPTTRDMPLALIHAEAFIHAYGKANPSGAANTAWLHYKNTTRNWSRLSRSTTFYAGYDAGKHSLADGLRKGYQGRASNREAPTMQTGKIPFDMLRATVRDVLEHPYPREWTVQGFGMLRTYLDADKRFRLNVWHSKLAIPNVSIVHDHPWHFRSWVMGGNFTNVRYTKGTLHCEPRYLVSACPPNFHRCIIKTGEGGGPTTEQVEDVFLQPMQPERYTTGDTYHQIASEVHASFYDDGTVTLNDRERVGSGEHASVFWPLGSKWVDAEPRPAFGHEVIEATQLALDKWFKPRDVYADVADIVKTPPGRLVWPYVRNKPMASGGFVRGSGSPPPEQDYIFSVNSYRETGDSRRPWAAPTTGADIVG